MQPFVLRGWMSSQHWILSFHLSPRHSTDISWTLNDMREKSWLYLLLLKNLSYFHLTQSCSFEQSGRFKFTKISRTRWGFQSTSTLHNNHLRSLFFFITFHSSWYISPGATIDPTQSNMNEFRWHLIISLLDESGLCLPPIRSLEKMSEACSRWSWPLEVSLFPAMERIGSYSPDWALGSVQAAAVNEPVCSLLCHAGVSGSPYTLPLFYLPMFLHGIRRRGTEKQVGLMKASVSVCPMWTIATADILTQLCLYTAVYLRVHLKSSQTANHV